MVFSSIFTTILVILKQLRINIIIISLKKKEAKYIAFATFI